MDSLFQDVRYGFGSLARSPGFTAIAVFTVGMVANAVRQWWERRGLAWAVAPILMISLPGLLQASGACPLTLVSGAGDRDSISVTFRNLGKLPIRRIEFNCVLARGQAHKAGDTACREDNAMFFSATPYTVRYAYPGGVAKTVLVSVKSVMLSDGYVWTPSRRETCRVLRIVPAPRKTDH
jgi:hypothetical protein